MKNSISTKHRRGDLWINPRSNLKGPDGNRGWDDGGNITPHSAAQFLALADIALGLRKATPQKKKATGAGTHSTDKKTEPYAG